jgi:sec-independent protein translocase protein TatA
MLGNLTGWHALILLAIVLLLFGATKLPALARSVGQSAKIFKKEIATDDTPAAAVPAPAPADEVAVSADTTSAAR